MLDLKGHPVRSGVGYRVDLGQVKLDRLNLWSARIVNVNLKGRVSKAVLVTLSVFENSYLRSVSFTDCDLHACMFRQCHMGEVKLLRTRCASVISAIANSR
ncbi:MAG: pentapeptide repeat-containing protein [Polyangiaceae bacterium]